MDLGISVNPTTAKTIAEHGFGGISANPATAERVLDLERSLAIQIVFLD